MISYLPGQWLGTFAGTNKGTVILDLDDHGDHCEGHALAFDNNKDLPGVLIGIRTPSKGSDQTFTSSSIEPLNPHRPEIIDFATARQEGREFPSEMNLKLALVNGSLSIEWETDIKTKGAAKLVCPDAAAASSRVPIDCVTNWSEFAAYVLGLEPHRYIFRGQPEPWRLRTAFHRTRRKDLVTYVRGDLLKAHYTLSGQTRHFFDVRDPLQNAAFINLLQHHGFPTPLLDWTHSPFVAAFFAFRRGQGRTNNQPKVRVFVFDWQSWVTDLRQIETITFSQPHFSIIEAFSFENPRATPQQSISAVTNLDDIETYIAHCEQERGKTYLQVIDLPFFERRQVMEQLRTMGITAASLFPGLDGACEELRGRFFHPL